MLRHDLKIRSHYVGYVVCRHCDTVRELPDSRPTRLSGIRRVRVRLSQSAVSLRRQTGELRANCL